MQKKGNVIIVTFKVIYIKSDGREEDCVFQRKQAEKKETERGELAKDEEWKAEAWRRRGK